MVESLTLQVVHLSQGCLLTAPGFMGFICLPQDVHKIRLISLFSSKKGLQKETENSCFRKVPKFSDIRKLRCNLLKIQTKSKNLRVFWQKDANGKANSEDSDQTAPLGAV